MDRTTYDIKCYALAEACLADYDVVSPIDDVADDLSETIQEAISDFLIEAASPTLNGDPARLREK